MKKLALAALAVILIASACNGHGSATEAQIIDIPGNEVYNGATRIRHNHEAVTGQAAYAYAIVERSGSLSGGINETYTLCIQYNVQNPAGDTVAQGEYCEDHHIGDVKWETIDTYWWSPYPTNYPVNAVESRILIRHNLGGNSVWHSCEYHDPDGSNPSWCPGIPA